LPQNRVAGNEKLRDSDLVRISGFDLWISTPLTSSEVERETDPPDSLFDQNHATT
jgi:hypothetical protein